MDLEQKRFHGFRADEAEQLFEKIKAGESVSVIGVSNVGKSNLIQQLFDPQVQAAFLGADASQYHFIRINFHNLPDFSNRSVYSLILEQLELLDWPLDLKVANPSAAGEIGHYHELLLEVGQDELRIQRYFKLAMRAFFQNTDRRLILIMDQFDQLYQRADERFFYNFRGLRDTYKYQISYLVFVNHALPQLTIEPTSDEQTLNDSLRSNDRIRVHEAFYELLQANQLYLKPYNLTDSEHLLRRVAERNHRTLESKIIEPLYKLTGGHAGLLRMCFLVDVDTNILESFSEELISDLLDMEAVYQECERIWCSFSEEERVAAAALAKNILIETVKPNAVSSLKAKGMLRDDGSLFSPLFAQYVLKQKTRLDRPFYLDEKKHVVYVNGTPSDMLPNREYRLFCALYKRENELVSQDELFPIVWPEEQENSPHTPQDLASVATRLRKLLKLSDKDKLIQGMKKYYKLINSVREED